MYFQKLQIAKTLSSFRVKIFSYIFGTFCFNYNLFEKNLCENKTKKLNDL